jgi:hypothetical protein
MESFYVGLMVSHHQCERSKIGGADDVSGSPHIRHCQLESEPE